MNEPTAPIRRTPSGGHGNRSTTPTRWIAVDTALLADWTARNDAARVEHLANMVTDRRESARV